MVQPSRLQALPAYIYLLAVRSFSVILCSRQRNISVIYFASEATHIFPVPDLDSDSSTYTRPGYLYRTSSFSNSGHASSPPHRTGEPLVSPLSDSDYAYEDPPTHKRRHLPLTLIQVYVQMEPAPTRRPAQRAPLHAWARRARGA